MIKYETTTKSLTKSFVLSTEDNGNVNSKLGSTKKKSVMTQ